MPKNSIQRFEEMLAVVIEETIYPEGKDVLGDRVLPRRRPSPRSAVLEDVSNVEAVTHE